MTTYILNEKGQPVEVGWEDYAAWYCSHRENVVIASEDIHDRRGHYVTTVTTKFRGHIRSTDDLAGPNVWVTEAPDEGVTKTAAQRSEAMQNHRRAVEYLRNCYCAK
jgi:hypothetical protein